MRSRFSWTTIEGRLADLADRLGWAYLAPGVVLVVLGLLILLVPRLLEALVATALIVAGASLVALGWRIRRLARPSRTHRWAGRPEQTEGWAWHLPEDPEDAWP